MRIACPNCDAAYNVPPDRVTPGRTVRCAKCSAAWTPVPPQSAPSPDPQRPPDPAPLPAPTFSPPAEPTEEPAAAAATALDPAPPEPFLYTQPGATPAPRPANRLPLLAAWVVSFGLLAGLCWAAVTYRDAVIRAWPPSERGYLALGLGQRPAAQAPAH